jgi:hypothetical protein
MRLSRWVMAAAAPRGTAPMMAGTGRACGARRCARTIRCRGPGSNRRSPHCALRTAHCARPLPGPSHVRLDASRGRGQRQPCQPHRARRLVERTELPGGDLREDGEAHSAAGPTPQWSPGVGPRIRGSVGPGPAGDLRAALPAGRRWRSGRDRLCGGAETVEMGPPLTDRARNRGLIGAAPTRGPIAAREARQPATRPRPFRPCWFGFSRRPFAFAEGEPGHGLLSTALLPQKAAASTPGGRRGSHGHRHPFRRRDGRRHL